jgi:hypothetical protein
MKSIRKFLVYVTNNEETPRHETEFDIAFFIINSCAVIFGGWYFLSIGQAEWIPFLIIEYTWAVDTMRHNRP